MVVPTMLYGFVVWGIRTNDISEKVQLRFHRYIRKVKNSTPSCMLHGELGDYPVDILSNV